MNFNMRTGLVARSSLSKHLIIGLCLQHIGLHRPSPHSAGLYRTTITKSGLGTLIEIILNFIAVIFAIKMVLLQPSMDISNCLIVSFLCRSAQELGFGNPRKPNHTHIIPYSIVYTTFQTCHRSASSVTHDGRPGQLHSSTLWKRSNNSQT